MQTILLVEDDQYLTDIYTKKLKGAGFKVVVLEQGKKVLQTLAEQKPDVLLLDIVLPEADGWAILGAIRENREFRKIKVIVLSNLGQKDEVEKGLRLGADKYLIKAHYTPSEVVKEIKKTLSN